MRLVASLVLALSLPSIALAAPKVKPRPVSPAATAAKARIAGRNIPKVVKFAKPKPTDLASIFPGAAVAVNPGVPKAGTPPLPTEPVLTTEELAVDIVELTPDSLHSPQVGTVFQGVVDTFGRLPGLSMRPGESVILFAASAQWISGRSLLVECTGYFPEAQGISLWRTQTFENKGDHVGKLTVDLAGDTLAFVVPSTQLAGWDRLSVRVSDADNVGYAARIDKCTLTRL